MGHILIQKKDLSDWLSSAPPGSWLIYHRGYLPIDAHTTKSVADVDERLELRELAAYAYWAAWRGYAYLVQRRHGFWDYSYIIIIKDQKSWGQRHRPREATDECGREKETRRKRADQRQECAVPAERPSAGLGGTRCRRL